MGRRGGQQRTDPSWNEGRAVATSMMLAGPERAATRLRLPGDTGPRTPPMIKPPAPGGRLPEQWAPKAFGHSGEARAVGIHHVDEEVVNGLRGRARGGEAHEGDPRAIWRPVQGEPADRSGDDFPDAASVGVRHVDVRTPCVAV